MKRILLRFENKNGTILTFVILLIVFASVTCIAFLNCEIIAGCIFTVLCAGAIAVLLYNILRKEIVIDFKHNQVKMKRGTKKQQCKLDDVKNIEIVFHQVKKMKCYSAQVTAYLKDGKTISIKIYPKRYSHRVFGNYSTGIVTNRFKTNIERQVQEYDFITCHTIN